VKILLYGTLLSSLLWSETTICYKKNLPSNNIYPNISLDGSLCKGQSLNTLKSYGWVLQDFKTIKNKLGIFNHIYILNKKENNIKVNKQILFDPTIKKYILNNSTKNSATIDGIKIQLGVSGIVIHHYNNDNNIILNNAIVTKSNDNSSVITFNNNVILKQDAIPTTKLMPQDGDIFIANYLYNSSLLIVPNLKAKQIIQDIYPKQNFINEDFFATILKMDKTPIPTKKEIQKFCLENQIGTIFFVIENKLYIVDAISFKIVYTQKLQYIDNSTSVPFFTKIKDIKKGFWDIFNKNKIDDYNSYYRTLIFDNKNNTQKSILKTMKELWPW